MKKFLSLALLLFAAPAAGQELVFGPEVELEEPELGLSRPMSLHEVSDRFMYWENKGTGLVMQYDRAGKIVRTFGALGEGPGEYVGIRTVVEVGDWVYIFTPGRAHRFRVDGTYDRSWGVPWAAEDALPLGGERFLVNATGALSPDMAALALHVVDLNEGPLESYDEFTLYSRASGHGARFLSSHGDKLIGVSRFYDLTVTEIDLADGVYRKLPLNAPWYPPYKEQRSFTEEGPVTPSVIGSWVEDGLLYVYGRTPDSRWRSGIGGSQKLEGRTVYEPAEGKAYLFADFMLDIYDADTFDLIDRITFDSFEEGRETKLGYRLIWEEDDLGFWHGSIRTVRYSTNEGKTE